MQRVSTLSPIRSTSIALVCSLVVLAMVAVERALGQNAIIENPDGAVKLQRIWYKLGTGNVDAPVGMGAGGISDINHDGYDDFAIINGTTWEVYLGDSPSPSYDPVWTSDSATYIINRPVVGDFLGNGESLIGFASAGCEGNGFCRVYLRFYRPDSEAVLVETGYELRTNNLEYCNNTRFSVLDLDRDGADELIMGNSCYQPEVWIYRGGEDFDLRAPTLKIVDSAGAEKRAIFEMLVADIDGDRYPDLLYRIMSASTEAKSADLKFWWGGEGTPWTWTNEPDRLVDLPVLSVVPTSIRSEFIDYNGDGVMDLTGNLWWADSSVFFLWLSGPEHNPRTRSYDSTDVDLVLEDAFGGGTLGYVADSTRRYHMLPISGPPLQRRDLYGLGGGADGPNLTYDTWVAGGESPLTGGWPAGDINGDGWEDRIVFASTYGGPGVGIALILAGGPYIPSDDPTVSVREEGIAGESGGLYLWPNPVVDELHIAWKGNLEWGPRTLRVHVLSGGLVVEGSVNTWAGFSRVGVFWSICWDVCVERV